MNKKFKSKKFVRRLPVRVVRYSPVSNAFLFEGKVFGFEFDQAPSTTRMIAQSLVQTKGRAYYGHNARAEELPNFFKPSVIKFTY